VRLHRNNVVRNCGIPAPPLLEEETVVISVCEFFLVRHCNASLNLLIGLHSYSSQTSILAHTSWSMI
jgi:hypothetical protein